MAHKHKSLAFLPVNDPTIKVQEPNRKSLLNGVRSKVEEGDVDWNTLL